MKYFLILLFCISDGLTPMLMHAQPQNPDTLNQTTEEGNRNGWWVFYYEDGQKKEEGLYAKGSKDGLWISYQPNGNKKNEITFILGITKGPARFYYEDGTLWEEGFWNEDCWNGPYRRYYTNGKKSYDWNYDDHGRRTGLQQYFFPNGKIKYRGRWEKGQIAGKVEVFDEEGRLTSTRQYHNGQFSNNVTEQVIPQKILEEEPPKHVTPFHGTGYHTIFRMDGKIEKKGYFRNGQLHNGKHYLYNDKDSLTEVKIIVNGQAASH